MFFFLFYLDCFGMERRFDFPPPAQAKQKSPKIGTVTGAVIHVLDDAFLNILKQDIRSKRKRCIHFFLLLGGNSIGC